MRKTLWLIIVLIALLTFESCEKKMQKIEPVQNEKLQIIEQAQNDTVVVPETKEEYQQITPCTDAHPSHSSSQSMSSVKPEHNNMRGFDPASEDDMDDNGISRYMENNDDEGWD